MWQPPHWESIMLTLKNTLKLDEPNWDFSHPDDYCEVNLEVSGELIVVAENKEELDELDEVYDWVSDWIEDKVDVPFGWSVRWNASIDGDIMTITVDETKPDPFYDYDDNFYLK